MDETITLSNLVREINPNILEQNELTRIFLYENISNPLSVNPTKWLNTFKHNSSAFLDDFNCNIYVNVKYIY